MSIVTVNLPGLSPSHAKDLVQMALSEWRLRRENGAYVETRYAHMDPAFRQSRALRLTTELVALSQADLNAVEG